MTISIPLPASTNSPRPTRLQRLLSFLESDPGNLMLRADVFESALQAGELGLAQDQLAVVRQSGLSPEWRMREANLAIAQEQLDKAESLLLSMHDELGPHPALAQNLGFISSLRGQHQVCLELIKQWADVPLATPVLPSLQALWLRTLHHLGQPERAVEWAQQRLNGGDLQPEVLGVASLAAFDANQPALAEAWANKALDGGAATLEARITQATLMLGKRDGNSALAATNAILQRYPQEGRTWSIKGFAHLLTLDLEQARLSLERATLFMPSHIGTWHGLGWTCLLDKDYDGARRAFDEALARNHNFAESHAALAVLCIRQGDNMQAQEHLRRAEGLDEQSFTARYARALLNGEVQDDRAIHDFAYRMLASIKPPGNRSNP